MVCSRGVALDGSLRRCAVFGLVGCGYLAGRLRLVTQASSLALNQFVYAFALPAMLFIAVYRGSLDEILSGNFLLAVIFATLATALAGFVLSYYVSGGSPGESTLRALNASFANTGYLGIPLVRWRPTSFPSRCLSAGLFVNRGAAACRAR